MGLAARISHVGRPLFQTKTLGAWDSPTTTAQDPRLPSGPGRTGMGPPCAPGSAPARPLATPRLSEPLRVAGR